MKAGTSAEALQRNTLSSRVLRHSTGHLLGVPRVGAEQNAAMSAQSRFAASDWLVVLSRHLTSVAMILSVISVGRVDAAVGGWRARRKRRNGEIRPLLVGSMISDWCCLFWASSDTLSFVPLSSPIASLVFLAARMYF